MLAEETLFVFKKWTLKRVGVYPFTSCTGILYMVNDYIFGSVLCGKRARGELHHVTLQPSYQDRIPRQGRKPRHAGPERTCYFSRRNKQIASNVIPFAFCRGNSGDSYKSKNQVLCSTYGERLLPDRYYWVSRWGYVLSRQRGSRRDWGRDYPKAYFYCHALFGREA